MVVKVAMADHFQFKVMPSIKNFCLLKQGDVHYIGGTDILPAPLGASEEQNAIEALGTASDAEAKHTLIEHNLRLVVYIAKKFDNTGVGVEDLISIGTIGLIKAINSYDKDKNIKLATYASRCIENEILMYLRRNSKVKQKCQLMNRLMLTGMVMNFCCQTLLERMRILYIGILKQRLSAKCLKRL